MNTSLAAHPLAPRHARAAAQAATIEWEEMPPLAPRMVPMDLRPAATKPLIVRPSTAAEFNTAWGVTMPAHLDSTPQPVPFQEAAIRGLVMREVDEPDLFKHFFG
ncbi:MAG TPA: hypothetical protein VFL64_10740 [Rhizobacter sp.]|nr:hypothetical protein [Rhizobacter sp.]